jgi:TolA-binding protein
MNRIIARRLCLPVVLAGVAVALLSAVALSVPARATDSKWELQIMTEAERVADAGDLQQAEVLYRKVIDAHGAAYERALLKLGETYMRANEQYAAAHWLERFLQEFPDSPYRDHARYDLGGAYLCSPTPDPAKAIEQFQAFLTRHPNSELRAKARFSLGEAYTKSGEQASAREAFKAVISDPQSDSRLIAEARNRLALLMPEEQKPPAAQRVKPRITRFRVTPNRPYRGDPVVFEFSFRPAAVANEPVIEVVLEVKDRQTGREVWGARWTNPHEGSIRKEVEASRFRPGKYEAVVTITCQGNSDSQTEAFEYQALTREQAELRRTLPSQVELYVEETGTGEGRF